MCKKKCTSFRRLDPYNKRDGVKYVPIIFRVGDSMIQYMCWSCLIDHMVQSITAEKDELGRELGKVEPRGRNNYRAFRFEDEAYGEIEVLWTVNNFVHLTSAEEELDGGTTTRWSLAQDEGQCITVTARAIRYNRCVSKTAVRASDMENLWHLTNAMVQHAVYDLRDEMLNVDQSPRIEEELL